MAQQNNLSDTNNDINKEHLVRAVQHLNSPDDEVRMAATALLRGQGLQAVPVLYEAARQGGRANFNCSCQSARILSTMTYPQHFDHMSTLISAPNPFVGSLAVSSLKHYGERSVPVLLAALDHSQILIQVKIITVLEEIGSQSVVQPLAKQLLHAEVATLRYTIIHALGVLGDISVKELILSFKDDLDHHVRDHVVIAVKRINNR